MRSTLESGRSIIVRETVGGRACSLEDSSEGFGKVLPVGIQGLARDVLRQRSSVEAPRGASATAAGSVGRIAADGIRTGAEVEIGISSLSGNSGIAIERIANGSSSANGSGSPISDQLTADIEERGRESTDLAAGTIRIDRASGSS